MIKIKSRESNAMYAATYKTARVVSIKNEKSKWNIKKIVFDLGKL